MTFFMTGAISQDRESCQFLFCFEKNPTVVPVGSAGERLGGARKVVYGAARLNSERAAPAACGWQAGFRLLRSARRENICEETRNPEAGASRSQEVRVRVLSCCWGRIGANSIFLWHVSVQTTKRYLGCSKDFAEPVNDRIGIEPTRKAKQGRIASGPL